MDCSAVLCWSSTKTDDAAELTLIGDGHVLCMSLELVIDSLFDEWSKTHAGGSATAAAFAFMGAVVKTCSKKGSSEARRSLYAGCSSGVIHKVLLPQLIKAYQTVDAVSITFYLNFTREVSSLS